MAIAHVQTVKAVGGNVTSVTTAGITTTAGNLLVVGCGNWIGSVKQSLVISDSKINTWPANPSSPKDPGAQPTRVQQFYVSNCLGGATHTFTATGADPSYIALFVSEFSGIALSSALDTNAGAIGSSTAPSSGVTGTRAQADELLVAVAGTDDNDDNTWTAGTNFTIPTNGSHGSSNEYVCAVEYRIVSSAGTDAGIFTLGTSASWGAIVGAFKMASAGGVTYPRLERGTRGVNRGIMIGV